MKQLRREYGYDDEGQPIMKLKKNIATLNTFQLEKKKVPTYAIRLIDIWKFSEDNNPHFITVMVGACANIMDILDLGVPTSQRMGEIAEVIQEGIDDLVRMRPQETMGKCIGEVSMTVAGETFSKDAIIQVPEA